MAEELTLEKFEEAYNIIKKVVLPTKLVESEYYSNLTGNKVFFKPENMQLTGAYKIRGAYYKISTLSDEEREKGLITASAGNHAQGVAYAAKCYGCKATIVMPTTTPLIKVNRTKGYGAEVVLYGDVYDEACEKAYELAKEKLQITLALSLHAPNDEKRRELMPIANRYSMDEVLDACRNYFQETGRRITFEYSLVAGVNDSDEDAKELSSRIHDINCHVNLIPVNPIKERSYRRSTHQAVENFKIKLEKCGINVTIRREMGSDIDGACGQLRKSYMEKGYDQQ